LQPQICIKLIGRGYDTASTYNQAAERARFAEVLHSLTPTP